MAQTAIVEINSKQYVVEVQGQKMDPPTEAQPE